MEPTSPAETTAPASDSSPVLGYHVGQPQSGMAFIACRVLAIWMFAVAVQGLGSIMLALGQLLDSAIAGRVRMPALGLAALPAILWGVMGMICWVKAASLGRTIMDGGHDPQIVGAGFDAGAVLEVALIAVGVFALSEGVPSLVNAAYRQIIASQNYSGPAAPHASPIETGLAAALIHCGIGVWLIVGSRGLTRIIQRARTVEDRSQDVPR
jgi:hypothetical protein